MNARIEIFTEDIEQLKHATAQGPELKQTKTWK
jgi:hypothetical protein